MSQAVSFEIKARYSPAIRWTRRGTCGEPGCRDAECACSLCGQPVGVAEDDPRWAEHDEWCGDCDLCHDLVAIQLFRQVGEYTEQAQFHQACFEKVVFIKSGCPS